MTFSALTSRTVPHHNKFHDRQGVKVTRIIPHHWAGLTGGDWRLLNPSQEASANYIIYGDGELVGQVPEEYRPWTSGSWSADAPSITIEIQNSGGRVNNNDNDPNSWKISAAAMKTLIKLSADIARRYKFPAINSTTLRGHREFYSTACPGGYLWARMNYVRSEANSILKSGNEAKKPSTSSKSIAQLAQEVLDGKHGNGDARKAALGNKFDAVQAEVNRRVTFKKPAPKPKAKTISQLVKEVFDGKHGDGEARKKSLGRNFNAVQAEINKQLAHKPKPKPKVKTNTQLAKEVLAGKHGDGDVRRRRLGSRYAAVQAVVNKLSAQK